jgi:outer membrane protein OmpA-like peptidoglycan-associated protein
MRATIASLIAAPLVAAPLVLATLPAAAQGNPNSDQIIQSLKPTGNLIGGGTRGIRVASPNETQETPQAAASGATPATHTARPTRAAAAGAVNEPSVSLSVQFATGSAELMPGARQTLDQLGKAVTSADLARYRFRIEGHTDTVGAADYNKALSQQRADAVAAYLEGKFGVSVNRLQTVGMGEDGLLVPTPPNTPNEKNRRVNVVNLGA